MTPDHDPADIPRLNWEQVSPFEYAAKSGEYYLCAEPGDDVTASRTERQEWETFAFVDAEAGQIEAIATIYGDICRDHVLSKLGHTASYAENLREVVMSSHWPLLPTVFRDEIIGRIISLYRHIDDAATLRDLLLDLCPRVAVPAVAGGPPGASGREDALAIPGGAASAGDIAPPRLSVRLSAGERKANRTMVLRDAHVIGHDWLVYAPACGALRHSDGYHHRYLSNSADRYYDVSVPATTRRIAGTAILLGGYPNYYHDLIDFKLNVFYYFAEFVDALIDDRAAAPMPTFLVRSSDQPYQRDLLRFLGVEASRCVQLADGEVAYCDRLVMLPQTVTTWGHLRDTRPLLWLARLARQIGPSPWPRRVYISREDAHRRKISNEAEVQAVMAQFGIAILHLERLSVSEQLHMFAYAHLVIGLHGAGLANIAVCARHTMVIEITPNEGGFADYFKHLATGLGHRFNRFPIAGRMRDHANYHVDCDHLRVFVAERLADIDV
jgi:capsular polysaccharide biosynthesis protein